MALVAGSIGLWRFLSPTLSRQLPGTIYGVTYESSDFIPTNLSATACQILDGGKLGPCTTVHVDGDSIAPSRNFKIGGLKRGVPYAVYVTANESWPTWFGTYSNKPFRQGLPAMDDVTKYPIRLITIPVKDGQASLGHIDIKKKTGISGTITPLDALGKNLDVEVCFFVQSGATGCTSKGVMVDPATGQYAAVDVDRESDYTVYASADGYMRTWLDGTTTLVPEIMNVTLDLPSSVIAKFNGGSVSTNQNISLVQGATITGTVSPEIALNRKVIACPVTLKNPTDLPAMHCGLAATDSYGHYSITVPAGATVELIAQADGYATTYFGGCVGNWLDCHHNPDSDLGADRKYRVTRVTAPDVGQTLANQNWTLSKHTTISGTIIGDTSGNHDVALACQFMLTPNSSGGKTLTPTVCTGTTNDDQPGTFTIGAPRNIAGATFQENLQPDTDYIVSITVYQADGTIFTVFVGGCRTPSRNDVSYQCLVDSGGIIHTPVGGGDVTGLTVNIS